MLSRGSACSMETKLPVKDANVFVLLKMARKSKGCVLTHLARWQSIVRGANERTCTSVSSGKNIFRCFVVSEQIGLEVCHDFTVLLLRQLLEIFGTLLYCKLEVGKGLLKCSSGCNA